VNGYFLCDRGRFGYEFVNSGKRIRKPLWRSTTLDDQKPADKGPALKHIGDILSKSKGIIGIGSPRASLESNFALRSLVGPDKFYSGMSAWEHRLVSLIIDILQKGPARSPSLHDVEMADAVLVLGEDVTNMAPLLDLALRQAARNKPKELTTAMKIPGWDDSAVRNVIQNQTGPLYLATITDTKLDNIATKTYRAAPDDIARLGFAIAHELNPGAPVVQGLTDDVLTLAREIAQALKNAKRPLIVSGTSLLNESIIQAAANAAWSLCESGKSAELCYTVPECNSMGIGLMGGKNLSELLHSPSTPRGGGATKFDTVIILENDLYRRADRKATDDFLDSAKHVIVIDHLINPTSSKAEITLPAGTFAESDGTLVNNEGRAQRFYQVFTPNFDIQESWKWIHDIMLSTGKSAAGSRRTFDDVVNELALALPAFSPVKDLAPTADFRIKGAKIPRQPHRYSGRTAMLANISVHEPKPPEDSDTPLSFSMEGHEGRPPSSFISRYWSPGWNSVQALNKYQQEVGGPLEGGDPGKRLIEPKRDAKPAYFTNVPSPSKLKPGDVSLPKYSIFGSEELSSYSQAVVEAARLKPNKDASS
jgi:NADH-quinone oxidoreductase subunit G